MYLDFAVKIYVFKTILYRNQGNVNIYFYIISSSFLEIVWNFKKKLFNWK